MKEMYKKRRLLLSDRLPIPTPHVFLILNIQHSLRVTNGMDQVRPHAAPDAQAMRILRS